MLAYFMRCVSFVIVRARCVDVTINIRIVFAYTSIHTHIQYSYNAQWPILAEKNEWENECATQLNPIEEREGYSKQSQIKLAFVLMRHARTCVCYHIRLSNTEWCSPFWRILPSNELFLSSVDCEITIKRSDAWLIRSKCALKIALDWRPWGYAENSSKIQRKSAISLFQNEKRRKKNENSFRKSYHRHSFPLRLTVTPHRTDMLLWHRHFCQRIAVLCCWFIRFFLLLLKIWKKKTLFE